MQTHNRDKLVQTTRERFGNRLRITSCEEANNCGPRGTAKRILQEQLEVDAFVSYQRIVDACDVELDTSDGVPWEQLDGYDHILGYVEDLEGLTTASEHRIRTEASNACQPEHFFGRGYKDWCLIRVPLCTATLQWYRDGGASKQVAYEQCAMLRRQIVQQLREWYTHGWEPHGAKCELSLEESHVYERSCWGFWSANEAWDFLQEELVYDIASQLTAAGYLVTDLPPRTTARQDQQFRYTHNLHLFDWDAAED